MNVGLALGNSGIGVHVSLEGDVAFFWFSKLVEELGG